MCLSIDSKTEIKTNPKNKFVFKCLTSSWIGYTSEFEGYRYKSDLTPEKEVTLKIHDETVSRGYHSWKNLMGHGFFGANFLFVIPKGAKIVEGKQHDLEPGYVSSTIICVGHLLNPATYIKALKFLD